MFLLNDVDVEVCLCDDWIVVGCDFDVYGVLCVILGVFVGLV